MAKEFNPDIEEYGKEKRVFGSKSAKRRFETSSTRAAVKGPGGEVHRGYTHANVYEDIADKTGRAFDEVIDEAYDPVTNKPTGKYEEGFSKYQEGKFRTRAVEGAEQRLLDPRQKAFATSEEIRLEEMHRAKYDPSIGRQEARAGSINLEDQRRRNLRAKKANHYLKSIKDEAKLLTRESPNVSKSPAAIRQLESGSKELYEAVGARMKTLTRRANTLKNLGRRAGVLGVVATPYTTGEALVGLASEDDNERLRSMETLFGVPEYSSGRGMSNKEKTERPVWYDRKTGEWGI